VIEPYPLLWPDNHPQTEERKDSAFKTMFGKARDFLVNEITRFGGRDVVITSNVATRLDGLPYANQKEPENPGVAVYFWRKGRFICMACDRYTRVKDNIQAIGKTVEAMRGIERWGSLAMAEKAVEAFAYLPEKVPGSQLAVTR
jgi:hypothetical protein